MHPVDFGLFCRVIVIALFLFGTVQNHISGRNDLFLAGKIEMRFTGSNVKKLIVQSSARTVRRKSFYCIQAVSAATSDKKRMLFILEIQPCLMPVARINIQFMYLLVKLHKIKAEICKKLEK